MEGTRISFVRMCTVPIVFGCLVIYTSWLITLCIVTVHTKTTIVEFKSNASVISKNDVISVNTDHGSDFNSKLDISRGYNTRRYLLPILFYNTRGPNSIYQAYRFAINYALHQNRTIVAVPFYAHSTTAAIQRRTPRIRAFYETFDMKLLSQLLPVASMTDFKRDCGRNISAKSIINLRIWGLKKRILNRQLRLKKYWPTNVYFGSEPQTIKEYLGIDLPWIKNTGKFNLQSALQFYKSKDIRCLTVLLSDSDNVYKVVHYHPESYPIIDTYLTRTLFIRNMADRVAMEICGGEDFAALHWRNMTGEGCRTSTCVQNLKLLRNNAGKLSSRIHDYVVSSNISCLYVAHPVYSGKTHYIVDSLIHTGLKVITQITITSSSSLNGDMGRFINDSYTMSLLEQEIAIRSSLFISNRWSNWSQFVQYSRDVQNKTTIDITNIPGIPNALVDINRLI